MYVFEGVLEPWCLVPHHAAAILKCLCDAGPLASSLTGMKWVSWTTPLDGWVAMNTGGLSFGNPSRELVGGVARDAVGQWVFGYAGFIGNSLVAPRRGYRFHVYGSIISWTRGLLLQNLRV